MDLAGGVARAAVGHADVEQGGQRVDRQQRAQRPAQCAGRADGHGHEPLPADLGKGRIERDRTHQQPADPGAEQGRADHRHLQPAVGRDQPLRADQLGDQAVLGRRIGRRAQADHHEGGDRMQARQQRQHTQHLDAVHPRHQPRLREGIGQRPEQRRQQHIRQREPELQHRRPPAGQAALLQHGDGHDQQGVVGQRGGELGGNQQVKARRHRGAQR